MSLDIPCDFAPKVEKSWVQFALGFGVAVIHIPGWIGASVGTSWFLLMFVMPILIYNLKVELTLRHFWGTLFLIYATFSLIWTFNIQIAFFHLIQLIVLGMVFYYGSSLINLIPLVQGYSLGIGISAVVALLQMKGIDLVYINKLPSGAPAGLFVNPNMFSEASAILLVALIVLKQYWWSIVTIPGVVFAHSRAAILALIVCGLIFMWNRSKSFVLLMFPVLVLLVIGAYYNNHFDISSLRERFAIWTDTLRGMTILGSGVGSFELMFPKNAYFLDTTMVLPKFAHNDYLQIIFEFGIGFLLLLPIMAYIVKSQDNERYIIYAAGVISMFSFPTFVPATAFIIILAAGYINRDNANSRNNGVYC